MALAIELIAGADVYTVDNALHGLPECRRPLISHTAPAGHGAGVLKEETAKPLEDAPAFEEAWRDFFPESTWRPAP